MNTITSTFVRKRQTLGKKCKFSDSGPHLIVDIEPDDGLKSQFVLIPRGEKETQCSDEISLHEVNTLMHPTSSKGMNHIVGGWPSDINPKDEDQIARFKKKIQKDESFISSVKKLGCMVENFVMENNSVDIYEEYFKDQSMVENAESQFKTISVFRDYSDRCRKVLDLSWALDGCKIAAAQAFSESHTDSLNVFHESYVWEIENSNLPYCILLPNGSLKCVEYSPRDLELILGGYLNGQIGLWDVRAGGYPQQMTSPTLSHKESVTNVKWITSKSGFEFLSCSTDGKLICWDSRNLSSTIQISQFDIDQNCCAEIDKNYGLTCIEYDSSLPHRLTLGTEQGAILSCNRKLSEMVSSCYSSHTVPVINITRNSFFPKLFASSSAWDVKIWSEDLTASPILNLRSTDEYCTHAAWSPSHSSSLFITKTNGQLELWDILVKHHEPVLSVKLESDGLTCVYPKQQGEQLACGTASGCIHLLNVPDYYVSSNKQEKNLMAAMIDREGKREKFLEGKNRELHLREQSDCNQVDNISLQPISSQRSSIPISPGTRSPRLRSPSPRSPSPILPSAKETVNEKLITDEVSENGLNEFTSNFDPGLKGDEEEVVETFSEKSPLDMQYCDVLNSVLETINKLG